MDLSLLASCPLIFLLSHTDTKITWQCAMSWDWGSSPKDNPASFIKRTEHICWKEPNTRCSSYKCLGPPGHPDYKLYQTDYSFYFLRFLISYLCILRMFSQMLLLPGESLFNIICLMNHLFNTLRLINGEIMFKLLVMPNNLVGLHSLKLSLLNTTI